MPERERVSKLFLMADNEA